MFCRAIQGPTKPRAGTHQDRQRLWLATRAEYRPLTLRKLLRCSRLEEARALSFDVRSHHLAAWIGRFAITSPVQNTPVVDNQKASRFPVVLDDLLSVSSILK